MSITVSVTVTAAMLAIATSAMAQAPPATVDRLGWLAGCWSRTLSDGVTEEQWMAPAGGTMLGMSRTVRGGKTTEYEFVQIREIGGSLAYVAKPSGQAEATFTLETLSGEEAVFENLAHDFPQRVIYRRSADGGVTARVEGTINGQSRGVDFPYARCK